MFKKKKNFVPNYLIIHAFILYTPVKPKTKIKFGLLYTKYWLIDKIIVKLNCYTMFKNRILKKTYNVYACWHQNIFLEKNFYIIMYWNIRMHLCMINVFFFLKKVIMSVYYFLSLMYSFYMYTSRTCSSILQAKPLKFKIIAKIHFRLLGCWKKSALPFGLKTSKII